MYSDLPPIVFEAMESNLPMVIKQDILMSITCKSSAFDYILYKFMRLALVT